MNSPHKLMIKRLILLGVLLMLVHTKLLAGPLSGVCSEQLEIDSLKSQELYRIRIQNTITRNEQRVIALRNESSNKKQLLDQRYQGYIEQLQLRNEQLRNELVQRNGPHTKFGIFWQRCGDIVDRLAQSFRESRE